MPGLHVALHRRWVMSWSRGGGVDRACVHPEIAMADLTEDERKVILGSSYRPPDPNAPKAPPSLLARLWPALTGRSPKA